MAGKPLLRMFSITIFVVFYSENSCFLFCCSPPSITVARFPLPLTFIINDDASSEENQGLGLVDQETHNACFSRCVFVRFVDVNMRDKKQCLIDRRNVIIWLVFTKFTPNISMFRDFQWKGFQRIACIVTAAEPIWIQMWVFQNKIGHQSKHRWCAKWNVRCWF